MKKFVFISIAALFALGTLQTQAQETKKEIKSERKALRKLKPGAVAYQSKQQFFADFGNIPDVKWKRSANYDEATFVKNGQKMTAYYDYDSKLVGTTENKAFADLPANAQKEIKAKYKGYTIGPVTFYDDNEANDTDMVLYSIQFDDQDNYFVELSKGNNKIVVRATPEGSVFFFEQL